MTIDDVILIVAGALAALLGGSAIGLFRRRKPKPTASDRPPQPDKTANEHEHEQNNAAADAVANAGATHGVDPSTVADDLQWADDVRRSE